MRSAVLAELELPVFREPTVEPRIGAETYSQRMIRLYERAGEGGFQALVVYGDREHSANLAYLTGYDPRFEESVLVMDVPRKSASLVMGHEGLGYFPISPIKDSLRPVLWQSLSLMGQDRAGTRPLREILAEAGVDKGDRVGVVGWKYFTSQEAEDPAHWIEAPSYLVDALRGIAG
ncbi:MAG TPA: hypothetical protein VGB32_03575, partial [Candidatus Bathyarchaeia archaeon]